MTGVLPTIRPKLSNVNFRKLPVDPCVTDAKSIVGLPATPLPFVTAILFSVPWIDIEAY